MIGNTKKFTLKKNKEKPVVDFLSNRDFIQIVPTDSIEVFNKFLSLVRIWFFKPSVGIFDLNFIFYYF